MNENNTARIFVLFLFFVIITMTFSCIVGSAVVENSSDHSNTQVLIYLVGSDLESKSGDATADIIEASDSYGNTNSKVLDVLIAFGGANKQGWEGMKIATMEEINRDLQDGTIGNGNNYEYSDPTADMGNSASLAKFLDFARTNRPSDRTILIISDHGNSYQGIGFDENTDNGLLLPDLEKGLNQGGLKFDPIIFDACLMGSVEVSQSVSPYSRYILASEEIQRGSFDYEKIIAPLAKNPEEDTLTLTKDIGATYISRETTSPIVRTVSIIDVSKVQAINEGLDSLGEKLLPVIQTEEGRRDIEKAYNDAIHLGISEGDKGTSVDLVSLLTNIEKKRPELSSDLKSVIALVEEAVVYKNNNKYSKDVSGISIASPDVLTPADYEKYGESIKIGPHWDEFFRSLLSTSTDSFSVSDSSSYDTALNPGSNSESDNVKTEASRKFELSQPSFIKKGNGTYSLVDPYDDASVYSTYYIVNGSNLLSIGSVPATPDQKGLYKIPEWDGRWFFLADTTRKINPILLDMEYDSTTIGGFDTFYSWIDINDKSEVNNASLVTFVNKKKDKPEMVISPYYETDSGDYLFGDSLDSFGKNWEVTSFTNRYNLTTMKKDEASLGNMVASSNSRVKYGILPDGTYASGLVAYYDIENELLNTEFRQITIKNGVVVNKTTIRL